MIPIERKKIDKQSQNILIEKKVKIIKDLDIYNDKAVSKYLFTYFSKLSHTFSELKNTYYNSSPMELLEIHHSILMCIIDDINDLQKSYIKRHQLKKRQ